MAKFASSGTQFTIKIVHHFSPFFTIFHHCHPPVVYLINHLPPDKASEGNWSAINIEEEKSLMSMGLASLEILDGEDFMVRKSIRWSASGG